MPHLLSSARINRICIIADRFSARQLILRRISEIVCMYISVTLRNPIISCATRKRNITCASVTLRNVSASSRGPWDGRRSCRTKLAHCKQISACSERQLHSPHNYSQRRCTHTPQRRPDRVRLLAYERKRQLQRTLHGPCHAQTATATLIIIQKFTTRGFYTVYSYL